MFSLTHTHTDFGSCGHECVGCDEQGTWHEYNKTFQKGILGVERGQAVECVICERARVLLRLLWKTSIVTY